MGVRGLSSFFDQNPDLSSDHKLHDCVVVIDGNNLAHVLYFSFGVECSYGGDYNKFAEAVFKYFRSFLQCNIKPIVIFDGGYDKSEKKLLTVIKRIKQRLSHVRHIAKHGTCAGKILPILAIEVLKDIMKAMGVIYVQCDYEADEHITAVANHFRCPVISQDSDFYIYNISSGFIRSDSLSMKVCEDTEEEGLSFKYLECKIYYIDRFLSYFPGMDKSVMPLFATLVGNDYVSVNNFNNFFANIQLPKFKPKLKVTQRHRKMIGLLSWLKYISLEDAIEHVLLHLKMARREQIRHLINKTVQGYAAESSDLIEFINNYYLTDNLSSRCVESSLVTFGGKELPWWFIKRFRLGDINPFLINAIGLHRAFLPSQVGEPNSGSSFDCSHYLRQVLYGVLLAYDSESSISQKIEEYDCSSKGLCKKYVEGVLTEICVITKFVDLDKLSLEETRNFMANIMGDNLEYFSALSQYFQFLFGVIRFWLRNCSPKPPKEFLYAVLLSVVHLMLESKSKHRILCHENCHDVSASDFVVVLYNQKADEKKLFSAHMKKFYQKPQHNNAHPPNLKILHAFSQLQACILHALYLNALLGKPFVGIRIQEFFCGTLIYNLTRELLSRPFPRLFVSELVGRDSPLDIVLTEMESKILEGIPEQCFVSIEESKSCRRKKTNRKKEQKHAESKESESDESTTELSNKFSSADLSEDVDVFL